MTRSAVEVMVVMMVIVVMVMLLLLGLGWFTVSGGDRCRCGGTVVFAQTPDRYAGVRSPGTAHALDRRPVMVIMLARRQSAALHQEQRAPVRVQQRADVLQNLVTQRPDVQFVAYVFHLRTQTPRLRLLLHGYTVVSRTTRARFSSNC